MKKRNGFVSNSSSSSFLIGVAKVPGNMVETVKAAVAELNGGRTWDTYELSPATTLIEEGKSKWSDSGYDAKTDAFKVTAFDDSYVVVRDIASDVLVDNDLHILHFYVSGQDPVYDEDSWEYNYDEVDLDDEWFSDNDLQAVELVDALGGDYTYGAGYNG